MNDNKPAICFIAQNAYGVLAQVDTGHAGGIEVQVPLWATWFAEHGYPVSMITWDEGYKDGTMIRDVRVLKLCRRNAGLPGLRFFTPRWSSLVSALRRADADIYCYACGDLGLGQVVLWAHTNGRKVLYSVVNKVDCDPALPALKPWRERVLYRYGLQHADRVAVQTGEQQELLHIGFDIDSQLVPMPSKGFPITREPDSKPDAPSPRRVLWIGRFSKEKRLEWLLDTAELCPELHFDVIGAPNAESDYSRSVSTRASAIPNVELHGRVSYLGLGEFYNQADLLCCSSVYEGFPNVFLEAFSVGLPLVSTVDPDDIIRRFGLGEVATNPDELRTALKRVLTPETWRRTSQAVRRYYEEHHTPEASMRILEEEFLALID